MLWVLKDDTIYLIFVEFLLLNFHAVIAVNCSNFSYPLHTNLSTASFYCQNAPSGMTCTFQCLNGYYSSGNSTVCANGSWTSNQQCLTSCENGRIDTGETDIDCGGDCHPCAMGSKCANNLDCGSLNCADGKCSGVLPRPMLTSQTKTTLAGVIVAEFVICALGCLIWHYCPHKGTTTGALTPDEDEMHRQHISSSRASQAQVELMQHSEQKSPILLNEPAFLRTSTGSPVIVDESMDEEAKKRLLLAEGHDQKQSKRESMTRLGSGSVSLSATSGLPRKDDGLYVV